jgi:E3 ubiquitin-protein ligase RNF14
MADDTDPYTEDERRIELDSISAIYPEIIIDTKNPFAASIDLPVVPSKPIPVAFPESSDGATLAKSTVSSDYGHEEDETHNLSYLPSLTLDIVLPEGYPSSKAPIFRLSTSPPWLSRTILEQLQDDGQRLWEEFGQDQVVFAYIDHIQQAAENAFGVLDENKYLEASPEHKISLLDYDIKSKRTAFEKETFHCGICLGEHGRRKIIGLN